MVCITAHMFSSPVAVVLSTVWDALKEELEGEGKRERGRGRGDRMVRHMQTTPATTMQCNTCRYSGLPIP